MSVMDRVTGLYKKRVKRIHEKGIDALLVILGERFVLGVFDCVQDAQDRARESVAKGHRRDLIRVTRVKATKITGTGI